MKKYKFILRRIIQIIPMLIIVTILAFFLNNISSADVAEITIRSQGIEVTEKNIVAVKQELGIDAPLHIQYINWLTKAIKFYSLYQLPSFQPDIRIRRLTTFLE
ncbi:Nickel transport system permease protein NikB [Clostridium formicaceticum]|uniref:Nickel transport system permease protein NikB n=2 Tax=Clostridium formicaceticum TaxID=1497 RepID=A0AAC9RMR6_9CLOT|nr:Nickel transport system permease protein NikB [Clostridium formicaceticum]